MDTLKIAGHWHYGAFNLAEVGNNVYVKSAKYGSFNYYYWTWYYNHLCGTQNCKPLLNNFYFRKS